MYNFFEFLSFSFFLLCWNLIRLNVWFLKLFGFFFFFFVKVMIKGLNLPLLTSSCWASPIKRELESTRVRWNVKVMIK
jgi:hypothetical protein